MSPEAITKFSKATICLSLAITITAISGCINGSHIDEMKSKGDIIGLASALNDSNKNIKSQAAEALGVLMAGKGQKEDPNLDLASYGTTKKNADSSLELSLNALKRALSDSNQDVKMEVIRALGEIGDRRAIEPLVQELKNDNSHIRAISAEALGNIGLKTKAARPLLAALKDSAPEVKSNAEKALKAMGLEPYPAPNTGTYLLGEPFSGQFEGWVLIANNTAPYDGIFKISHEGGNPYIAVFIRSGDTYYIENIPPGEKITATFGEDWDNDRKMFTKNVYNLYLGEATPIRRSTQRHEW